MKARFLKTAQKELAEAIDFYDEREYGLGDQFREEAYLALERILKFPARGRHSLQTLVVVG